MLCRVHAVGDARRVVDCVEARQAAARQAREVRRRRGAEWRRDSAVGGGVDAWSAGAAAAPPPRLFNLKKPKGWAVPPPPQPPPQLPRQLPLPLPLQLPLPPPPPPPLPLTRQPVRPIPKPPPPQRIEVALIGALTPALELKPG